MASSINPRILKTIREKTADEAVEKCLEELLFIESGNPAWFKDEYKKTIEKHAENWSAKK